MRPFRVRFWGIRGSVPTPGSANHRYGGNTSCVEVRVGETLFICDAGTGIRDLGQALVATQEPIEAHLFFSHTHWDHIQGFPYFAPAYSRDHQILVYGTDEGDTRFHRLLSGQMSSDAYFPVDFKDLKARIEPRDLGGGHREIDGVKVSYLSQHHPGGSFAYAFEVDGRKLVYATDHELDAVVLNRAKTEENPDLLREPPADFLEFIEGADLLVGDAQYTDAEYLQHVGWGHSRATTLTDAAIMGGVKQLALFHHDPMQSDAAVDAKVETCQARAGQHGSKLQVFGAREGLQVRIERD